MSKLIEESKDEKDQATGLNLTATSALNHDQQGSDALQNQDECTNLPLNASKQFNEGFDLKTQEFSTSASLDLDMQNLTLTETGNEIYQENSGSTTNSSSYPAQNNHQTFFNNEYAHQQGFYPEIETKISPSNSSNGSIKNQKVSPISDHQKQTVGNDLNSFLNHQASRSGNDNEGSNTHDQFNYSEFYSDYPKSNSSEVPDFSQGLSPNFTQGFSGNETVPMGVYNPYNIAVDTNLPYNGVKKISPSAVGVPSAADKAPIFPSRMTPHQQILWQQQRAEEVEREKARLELKEQQYLIDQFTQNNTNNFNNHNNNNNNNINNNSNNNSSKNNSGNNSVTNESTFAAGLKSYSMSPGGTNYQNSGTGDVAKAAVRSAGNTPMNFQTANTPVNSLNSTGSSGYSVPAVTPTVGGNLIGASTPRNNSINYNTNNSMLPPQPMANKYYGNDFDYNNNYNNSNNNTYNNNINNNNNNNINNNNNATAINSNFNHLSGSYKQQQFSPQPTTYNNNILNNNLNSNINSNINATMAGAAMSNNLYVSTLGAYNTAPSTLPYAPAVPAPLNAYPNSNIMNTGYSYGNNVYGNNSNYGAPLATAGVNNNINNNMNTSYDNNNYSMNYNENNTNSTNFPTANSNTNTNINPLINPVTGLANPIASNQSFNNYLHGAQIMQQQQQQLSQSRQMNIMNQMKGANVKDLKATVFMIQLKTLMKHCVLGPQASKTTTIGDFVIIDADRGEDIGIVVETLSMEDYLAKQRHDKGHMFHPKPSTFNHKHAHEDEDAIGKIIRIASVYERQQLPAKYHDEENIKEYCREIARQNYAQSVMIMEAEYQFDRNKLIIYYDSTVRIDFRELVRDLFSAYKTRIWLKKYNVRHFFPKQYAVMGLATGVQFQPDC